MAPSSIKSWFRNNGLSLVLGLIFLVLWLGQSLTGWKVYNDEQAEHHLSPSPLLAYLQTGHYWESVFENWESEFLQMAAYVVLTTFLYQKGSAESNAPHSATGK